MASAAAPASPDKALTASGGLGVNLGRRDAGVAQQLLDRLEVVAVAQAMRRERVPQDMRRDRVDAGLLGVALDDQPEALPRDAQAVVVEEQRRLRAVVAADHTVA